MIRHALLGLLIAAVSLVAYLYIYLGASKPVTVQTQSREALHLLFKTHLGAYHLIGSVLTEAEAWARRHNVPCPKTFGEFLDNPESVDQDRLRSRVGCVLTEPPNAPLEGFQYELRHAGHYLVGEFEGSPSIGPFKVYPLMKEKVQIDRLKWNGLALEIYQVNGSNVKTEYLFPLDQNASHSTPTPKD